MLLTTITTIVLLLKPAIAASASWIVPGAVWYDTDGKKIDAHGGGIFQKGNTFYWVGQSAANNETPMMYSSTDLLNWKNLGPQAFSVSGLWRPKIATPSDDGSFWLYGQQDRYVLSLKSSQLAGGYQTSAKTHLPPSNYSYSDTGMFFDESSSTWYLLTSADHNTVQINKINKDGTIGSRVEAFTGGAYEAPGLFKANGVYFLIVSGKTGWRSNPNKVFSATSLSGPWSDGTNIAPESEKTYNSQNTFELTIRGSKTTTYIYMGDSWDSKGSTGSTYVWLPMDVVATSSAKSVTLQYHAMWKVDVDTGVVSYPSAQKRLNARDAELSLHGRYAGELKDGAKQRVSAGHEVTFYNITGTGKPQWISFLYTVNNPQAGDAHIRINDDPTPIQLSDLNSCAGFYHKVPVQVVLRAGDANKVSFSVSGASDFEAVLDGLEVFD